MNIQDYIASGIIEQYVLGDVPTQEKKEVEAKATKKFYYASYADPRQMVVFNIK